MTTIAFTHRAYNYISVPVYYSAPYVPRPNTGPVKFKRWRWPRAGSRRASRYRHLSWLRNRPPGYLLFASTTECAAYPPPKQAPPRAWLLRALSRVRYGN